MGNDPPAGQQSPALAPLTTMARQRLQKVFEHAQRCMDKDDHDYATKLLTQCVVEDPSNLIYLQAFLGNLENKYGDNKKGSRLAGLRIKSQRQRADQSCQQGRLAGSNPSRLRSTGG